MIRVCKNILDLSFLHRIFRSYMYQIATMKKIYSLLLILFAGGIVNGQSNLPCVPCLPQGITFITQSQIDSFPIIYPNCTEIEGHVTIGSAQPLSNITNLLGLSSLTSFAGDLIIEYSPLQSLTGLDSVTYVGGIFVFRDNDYALNLSGLNSLTWVGSNFIIESNDTLTSLAGLNALNYIGGDVTIGYNDPLTSLQGLESLTSIGASLFVTYCHALTNLVGLNNLTQIGSFLAIEFNNSLQSLFGLDNIDAATINGLYIAYNINLSHCEIESICEYLASPNGTILIKNNKTGCNSQQEVEDACAAIGVEELNPETSLAVYPNPTSTTLTIETPAKGSLSIYNICGQQLLRQDITVPTTSIDVSGLRSGVCLVKFVGTQITQVGKFIKQ